METIFFEISAVLIVCTFFATIAGFFKQPLIPAYIFAGVLLGPLAFDVLTTDELLETLSTFGIAFLLFLVGIELDLRKLLRIGRIAVIIGVLQMGFAVGAGYLVIRALGFTSTSALFLALALGFSSTIVIMKLLSERKELDTLYGQLIIGLMLTQDFIAVLCLIFFNVFISGETGSTLAYDVLVTFLKGAGLILLGLLASKYVLSRVFRYFAKSTELLFLGAIAWCLVFAGLSLVLGFSIEVGSLLAGVSLSYVPYSLEIANRIKSLRDFFLPIFFAVLGAQLVFTGGAAIVVPTVVLSALVLFASPILVVGALLIAGYRTRTSFTTGVAVGQISEFSFILVGLGYAAGIIERDIVALVALIGLVTMTLSTYMFEYIEPLYKLFRPILKRFERKKIQDKLDDMPDEMSHHVVLIGCNTMGAKMLKLLLRMKLSIVVIDNNPDIIRRLGNSKVAHLYGSMNDEEVFDEAHITVADYVISTVPDHQANLTFLEYKRKMKLRATTVLLAFSAEDALEYYKRGASMVIVPTIMSADAVTEAIDKHQVLKKHRDHHIKELKEIVAARAA